MPVQRRLCTGTTAGIIKPVAVGTPHAGNVKAGPHIAGQTRPKMPDLRSGPVGVRGFKSLSRHSFFSFRIYGLRFYRGKISILIESPF